MIESITKNIFAFYSPNLGSNVYILCGKEIVLIDTSINTNEKQLKEGLSELHISPEDVSILLFTHAHADHIGCANLFRNSQKFMHEKDAEAIELGDLHYTLANITGQEIIFNIDKHLSGNENINIEPFSLKIIHTPGHTKGSVCYYEQKQKLLFSGDTLFAGNCGRTDLPGGDEKKLLNSISMLKNIDFKLLLPGHGVILKSDQKANIDFVLKTLKAKYL
ncbi:MAG: MBL fold metallo-hydrolase [Candidatus Diapherotrites archaeon]|nr:MBL fold metallo-hydrolase [Candidatus Diapherotrites archaeon]